MKIARRQGAVSQILQVFIQDSSSTVGAGLKSLTPGSTSLTLYYHQDSDASTGVAVTLTTMTIGTYKSGGFAELNQTNLPGCYQVCFPNAAFATTAASVLASLRGATNMADLPIEIDLDAQVDTYYWNGSPVQAPNTAGVPAVDVTRVSGASVSTSLAQFGVNRVSPTTTQALTINGSLPGALNGLMLAGTNSAVTVAALSITGAFISTNAGNSVSGITVITNNDKTGYSVSTVNDKTGYSVSTVADKTGYSLSTTQTFNNTGTWTGNIVGSVNSVNAGITVSTNADKTGYSVSTVSDKTGYGLSTTQVFNNTGTWTGNIIGSVNSVNAGVTVSTNADKTGYSVSTVFDKSGYSITSNIKKNQALNDFEFLMTDSTLHAPALGLIVSVTRSIDGAAFAAGTLSAVTEVGNGIYAVNFGSGDLNGSVITLQATAAGSDTTFERIVTQP